MDETPATQSQTAPSEAEEPQPEQPALLTPEQEAELLNETRSALQRAKKEYPRGLQSVFSFGKEILRGNAIFHAAYAAEKISKESVERVVTQYVPEFGLEAADIPHATEADKKNGPESTRAALELGFRRKDIPHAAACFEFWPMFDQAVDAMGKMVVMLRKVRADVHEGDIRASAVALRNLDITLLERALRDRHPKNEREPWLRGMSIPLVAYCYKLSAPHTGPAIDDCRKRRTRRERIGYEVLSALGRRFRKTIPAPGWLS
ncbi:MAG: hypothetical protein ACYTAF_00795 [Planctomycetota bacterium]|jgi:hypothetical protein